MRAYSCCPTAAGIFTGALNIEARMRIIGNLFVTLREQVPAQFIRANFITCTIAALG